MIVPDLSEDTFCPCPVFATCKTDSQLLNELWVWCGSQSDQSGHGLVCLVISVLSIAKQ